MIDLIILAAFLNGPAYGYSLKRTAGLIFGSGALHNNVIYPSLKRFVRSGWVKQKLVAGDRGQQRKQYELTAAGRKYLFEEVGKFGEQDAADEGAFLLRVALFEALPQTTREAIIAARKSFLTVRAAELSRLREIAPEGSFGLAAIDRIHSRYMDELRWIRKIEKQLEAGAAD